MEILSLQDDDIPYHKHLRRLYYVHVCLQDDDNSVNVDAGFILFLYRRRGIHSYGVAGLIFSARLRGDGMLWLLNTTEFGCAIVEKYGVDRTLARV